MPQQEKEPQKTKTTKDWEKEKQLQKTFELIIQQKQALESTLKIALRSQPLVQKSFGPSKTEIDFTDKGAITKKHDVF